MLVALGDLFLEMIVDVWRCEEVVRLPFRRRRTPEEIRESIARLEVELGLAEDDGLVPIETEVTRA